MSTKNDITGDAIQSRPSSPKYRENWDRIFAKPNKTYLNESDFTGENDHVSIQDQ